MVECTALEMRRALTGTVGSNPTLSATHPHQTPSLRFGVQGSINGVQYARHHFATAGTGVRP